MRSRSASGSCSSPPAGAARRRATIGLALALAAAAAPAVVVSAGPTPERILDTMKRATRFMVEEVSTEGGYVWTYLPDRSRRWGELEARPTQIWIQPPGTATMGHLFLDAYHATADEYYYRAAEAVGRALVRAQHRSGGWNYLADFAGPGSLREWYATIGRNAWRMEEFRHQWDNATFDDAGTAESSRFLLRLFVEKRDAAWKAPLDRAIAFVLDSQHPIGAWPQRYPRADESGRAGHPEYPSYLTFNDNVTGENVDFLVMCHQALGHPRARAAIDRAMAAVLATQLAKPQPGWALQYTPDLQPAAARSYEPKALATHTTAANVDLLLRLYRLTGDARLLARIPEALDWLDGLAIAPGSGDRPGVTHPTFIELGTNRPLYVHRRGSNVANGEYYVDTSPAKTLAHYGAFRRLDVAGLRQRYQQLATMPKAEATAGSPLLAAPGAAPLPRFHLAAPAGGPTVDEAVAGLNEHGYWPARLGMTSHRFTRQASPEVAPGDFSQTHVGDETDTSPFPDQEVTGISTAAYLRHMRVLIRAADGGLTR